MKESLVAIIDLLEQLIFESETEMIVRLNNEDRVSLRLSMPRFLIDRLPDAIYYKHHYSQPLQSGVFTMFAGIQIIESSDLAITLFHVDYPLRMSDWMIRKISLEPVRRIESEYEQYVIKIRQLPFFKTTNTHLN